jgi:hypothetical protein
LAVAAVELSVDGFGALHLGYATEQVGHPLCVLDGPTEDDGAWLTGALPGLNQLVSQPAKVGRP